MDLNSLAQASTSQYKMPKMGEGGGKIDYSQIKTFAKDFDTLLRSAKMNDLCRADDNNRANQKVKAT